MRIRVKLKQGNTEWEEDWNSLIVQGRRIKITEDNSNLLRHIKGTIEEFNLSSPLDRREYVSHKIIE